MTPLWKRIQILMDGGLVWIAVTAAAYLTAGLVVFRVLERVTKSHGSLGAY